MMARFLNLVCWFVTGAIAFTTAGYFGLVFPQLKDLVFIGAIVATLLYVGLWLVDDALIRFFQIDSELYYGLLIGILAALFVGMGAMAWYLS